MITVWRPVYNVARPANDRAPGRRIARRPPSCIMSGVRCGPVAARPPGRSARHSHWGSFMRRSVSPFSPLAAVAAIACAGHVMLGGACDMPLMPKAEVEIAPQKGDARRRSKMPSSSSRTVARSRLGKGTYKLTSRCRSCSRYRSSARASRRRVIAERPANGGRVQRRHHRQGHGVGFKRKGETARRRRRGRRRRHHVRVAAPSPAAWPADAAGGNGLALFNDSTATVTDCVASRTDARASTCRTRRRDDHAARRALRTARPASPFSASQRRRREEHLRQERRRRHPRPGSLRAALIGNKCRKNRQTGILFIGKAGGIASKNRASTTPTPGSRSAATASPELSANFSPESLLDRLLRQGAGVARANTCKTEGTGDIGIAVYRRRPPQAHQQQERDNLRDTSV